MSEQEYDPLFTISALNMAIVSLHRITSTRDRLILDREYNNIINNLQIGEIKPDPALTNLYQEIVRVIHRGKLRGELLEEIDKTSTEEKRKSVKDIVTGNIMPSFNLNPLKWLGKLASSSASEYFTQKKQTQENEAENHDGHLKLKHEELDEYDELQRKLLNSSWQLLREYGIPGSYILTQNGLDDFYRALQESDSSTRLRMLRHLERDFSMYYPYWFYRAQAAHDSGNHEEEENSFSKFNEVWRGVLKKDPYKLEALKFKINELVSSGVTAENVGEILRYLSEFERHTQRNDWASHIYAGMLYFTLGDKEKAIECVICNMDFGYETESSQAVLTRFETEKVDAVAQFNIGVMYDFGYGVDIDKPKAIKWYRKAAEQGLAAAQYNLALKYDNGEGVAQDKKEAVKWYRKAAEQGYAAAQFNLGCSYDNGEGVTQDKKEAVNWYRKAAEQGRAAAQYNLALKYDNGEGVAQDKTEAVKWYRKAAEQGYANAQNNLGNMYSKGEGVAQDKTEAVKWYRKAAEQGRAAAQFNLGCSYDNGEGVTQDKKEAVNWYRKAAEQEYAAAQYNLALMYDNGEGVAQDKKEAVKWYRKAAEQGLDVAQKRLRELGETW